MTHARPGPHLAAVLRYPNVHWEVFHQGVISPLRLTVATRVPCAGAPNGRTGDSCGPRSDGLPKQLPKCDGRLTTPLWKSFFSPYVMSNLKAHIRAPSSLRMVTQRKHCTISFFMLNHGQHLASLPISLLRRG